MPLTGALLQKLNRDTQKCAYKCSFAVVDGQPRDVFKSPITDAGKKSKRGVRSFNLRDLICNMKKPGRLALVDVDGKLTTVEHHEDHYPGVRPWHVHCTASYQCRTFW